jgi:glycosyltransferase involved in cell wall biosynthesis
VPFFVSRRFYDFALLGTAKLRSVLAFAFPRAMISILCPCCNEEESLPIFFREIIPVMESLGEPFELVFVNDGSRDATLEVLLSFAEKDSRVKVVDLSRNFGKEAALTAAIDHASGDAVIPMDADLQHPVDLIPQMVGKWKDGYKVVLAKRKHRAEKTRLKRFLSGLFYRLHNLVAQPKIPENVGDFRLISREVCDAVKLLPERYRFMKGIFAWVGFETCTVDYVETARRAGKTNFSYWRLWKLALDGITSFSTFPLTIFLHLGGAISLAAILYSFYIFLRTLLLGAELPGYASLICLILFLSGLHLLGIGILGEYVGRTYIESKQRPIYIVRSCFQQSGSEACQKEKTGNIL